jgi:hypothetical protein
VHSQDVLADHAIVSRNWRSAEKEVRTFHPGGATIAEETQTEGEDVTEDENSKRSFSFFGPFTRLLSP